MLPFDEDIKSSSDTEYKTRSPEDESMKLKRARESSELSSTQLEVKIKHDSSSNNCKTYSDHSESAPKENQIKRSSCEKVIENTLWQIFNGRDGDIQSLIESFRLNQDEPSYKFNCFGFSTHKRKNEDWIHDQILFGLRVMDFTRQVNQNFPDLNIGALIEGFRLNRKELSYESSWSGILTQPGSSSNWIHDDMDFGLRFIQILRQKILNLLYFEAHGPKCFQTYVWRPGDNLGHLVAARDVLSCTINQGISQISLCSHFPNPSTFTFGPFMCNSYFLFELIVRHELKTIPEAYRRPINRGYIKLISRYKTSLISIQGSSCIPTASNIKIFLDLFPFNVE